MSAAYTEDQAVSALDKLAERWRSLLVERYALRNQAHENRRLAVRLIQRTRRRPDRRNRQRRRRPRLNRSLRRAIALRRWVRTALANDDLLAVCRLNRLADAAYLALGNRSASLYLQWARKEAA